jgi:hypothetical protein
VDGGVKGLGVLAYPALIVIFDDAFGVAELFSGLSIATSIFGK